MGYLTTITVPDVGGVEVTIDPRGAETDIRVQPPTAEGLAGYIDDNARRAEELLKARGPFQAVATFEHPIGADRLLELDSVDGVTVYWYEAIGALPDGVTMTLRGTVPSLGELDENFAGESAELHGIVAAEVLLDTGAAFAALDEATDILLVDLAAESVARAARDHPRASRLIATDTVDVVLDDVYWQHAGLSR